MRNRWASGDKQGAMRNRWVLRTGLSLLALLAISGVNAGAQADLNCDDFANQADAQASLNGTYPEDPNRLDADKDWIACEDFFELTDEEAARVVPANLVNSADQPTPEPTPEPAPKPATDDAAPTVPDDAAPAAPLGPAGTGSRIDPPADLMAQVAACEVVAVSSRSIAAAGCPGVGTIVLRPPAGTPRMRSQVIIRPGAALRPANERVATAEQSATLDEGLGKRDRDQQERPRKKRQKGAGHASTRTK
jgi:hypothetical protein